MYGRTASGQRAVQLVQRTASLSVGSGQWNSCQAVPHCPLPMGSGQGKYYNALPHCLGAVGRGTLAMHCLTALGKRALQLLVCATTPPGGGGQWNSCNAGAH